MIADAAYVRGVGSLPPDVEGYPQTPPMLAACVRRKRWVGAAA
jgi:hypothetical protein